MRPRPRSRRRARSWGRRAPRSGRYDYAGEERSRTGGGSLGAGLELSTERLEELVEHNQGDLTAVLQAGIPLARDQEARTDVNQMIAIDRPLGQGGAPPSLRLREGAPDRERSAPPDAPLLKGKLLAEEWAPPPYPTHPEIARSTSLPIA